MSYSNSGYVLGYLIEKITLQTYDKFVQENIFAPLGMKDSGYDSNSAIIPHRVKGYEAPNGLIHAGFIHMTVPFSAGALYSTTEELQRWEQGLFGGTVLSASSLQKIITPFENDYAFGLIVHTTNGHKVIWWLSVLRNRTGRRTWRSGCSSRTRGTSRQRQSVEVLDPAKNYMANGKSQVLSIKEESVTGKVKLSSLPSTLDKASYSSKIAGGESGVMFFAGTYADSNEVPCTIALRVHAVQPENKHLPESTVVSPPLEVSTRAANHSERTVQGRWMGGRERVLPGNRATSIRHQSDEWNAGSVGAICDRLDQGGRTSEKRFGRTGRGRRIGCATALRCWRSRTAQWWKRCATCRISRRARRQGAGRFPRLRVIT